MPAELLTTTLIDRAFDLYPDLVGVIADDGTAYTYGEIQDRVYRLANQFAEWGLEKGDRVAIVAPNTHWFLETLFATQHLGLVVVPLNYRLTASEFEYLLNDAEPAVVVVDSSLTEKVDAVRDNVPVERFVAHDPGETDGEWSTYESLLSAQSATRPTRPHIEEDDPSTINYTSGTTGEPKGVVRTHRNDFAYVQCQLYHQDASDGEVYLWTLPLFHVNGWGFSYAITAIGGTHVCLREFDPRAVFDRIRTYDVTHLCGAAAMLERLIDFQADHDVPTTGDRPVRVTTAGSSPSGEVIEAIETEFGWDVIHIYGTTETGTISTSNDGRRLRLGDSTAITRRQGVQTIGTRMRVVDAGGEDVPRDDETMGEIVARGPQIMEYYLNKPEVTHRTFHDRVEGWFHTGDLATVDEHGMVRVRDRKSNVIVSGGENVSSVEVENVLRDHEAVSEVAVIGVPSEEWGEAVKAVVAPTEPRALTEEALLGHAREKLAGFKVPREIEFVDSLPTTATGKIKKKALRDRHWRDEDGQVG